MKGFKLGELWGLLQDRVLPMLQSAGRWAREQWFVLAIIGSAVTGLALIGIWLFDLTSSQPLPAPPPRGVVEVGKASISMVEFTSPGCVECAQFHAHIFPLLMQEYIFKGKVRYELRVLADSSADAEATAIAQCVHTNNYLAFMDLLLRKRDTWAPLADEKTRQEKLLEYAQFAGVDRKRAIDCMESEQRLKDSATETKAKFGITHVPALMIGTHIYNAALSWAELKNALDGPLP